MVLCLTYLVCNMPAHHCVRYHTTNFLIYHVTYFCDTTGGVERIRETLKKYNTLKGVLTCQVRFSFLEWCERCCAEANKKTQRKKNIMVSLMAYDISSRGLG